MSFHLHGQSGHNRQDYQRLISHFSKIIDPLYRISCQLPFFFDV
jgi:hypothetical protein